jgi:hypothetical protein
MPSSAPVTKEAPKVGRGGDRVVRVGRPLALSGGLGIAVIGLLVGIVGYGLSFVLPEDERLLVPIASASACGLSLSVGGAMAWQAWQSIQGRPSRQFHPQRVWIGVALFFAALLIGWWAGTRPPLDLILLPFAHLAATALPPLVILGLVARSLAGATRVRYIVLQLGSGAFLSTFLAMVLELLLVVGLALGLAILIAVQPGGEELFQELERRLTDPSFLQNPGGLDGLAGSPWVWVTLLAVMCAAIPLIEESVKTLGVGLMLYRKPEREEAYLWGLASGAGFAMAESALNSLLGLDGWATAVVARVPASLMHCFTGALMGLAWHAALMKRQWMRGLGLFAACIALHGLWNGLTVTLGLLSADQLGYSPLHRGGAELVVAATPLIFAALALGTAVALGVVTRRVRLAQGSQGQGSPVAAAELEGAPQWETERSRAQLVSDPGTASGSQAPERGAEADVL